MSVADIRTICRETYQESVRTALDIPSDLRIALRAHERVPAFIDRLAVELGRCKFRIERHIIEEVARDMTRLFISNVVRMADERMMSDAEKARRITEAQEAEAMSALFTENPTEVENEEESKAGTIHRSTLKV